MNAGAHKGDIASAMLEANILLRDGSRRRVTAGNAGFGYRSSNFTDAIVTEVTFAVSRDNAADVQERMTSLMASRRKSQPVNRRTGGSTFANPPGHSAWQLIDEAGCRGLRRGDAQVSTMHTNFLINLGSATADDLEGLGETVRDRVLAKTGILLAWEIKRIGSKDKRP
jgi:UDP-N-acetylmuramate dehydrogenase